MNAPAAAEVHADDIRAIARGVLDGTYPAAAFHHREHCLLTAYLIREHRDWDLRVELPALIKRYTIATGGANTDTSGYHHTLTMFFLYVIERFLAQAPADLTQACRQLLLSPIAASDHALEYYSREQLFSREARLGWVAPDRQGFATMHSTTRAETAGAPLPRSTVDEPQ